MSLGRDCSLDRRIGRSRRLAGQVMRGTRRSRLQLVVHRERSAGTDGLRDEALETLGASERR